MSEQKRVYTRRVPVLRTLESRRLNENERCNLLKRKDGFYQVILKQGKINTYLVEDISQYDARTIEDAFYRIKTSEDFFTEKRNLVLRLDEGGDGEGGDEGDLERDLEGDLDDTGKPDPFRYAEEMLNHDDKE